MAFELEERRRFPRVKLKSPLHYQIRGSAGFENAVCDNISLMGVGFIGNKYIAPQTLLMLEINVLNRILRPVGRIVSSSALPHSDRNRLGIEFLEFDSVEKNYLREFIYMQLGVI